MSDIPKISDYIGNGKKLNYRQFFMVCVLTFITAAEILMDYVNAGFDAAVFGEAAYWVELVISLFSVIFVTLAARDLFRERELLSNENVKAAQAKIKSAHAELISRDLMTRFENYVDSQNNARRLKAYTDYLRRKHFKAKRKKKEYWQGRIKTAASDIEFFKSRGRVIRTGAVSRVKYIPIKTTTIFANVDTSDDDADDLSGNEAVEVGKMLTKKVTMVFAMFFSFSTLFFTGGSVGLGVVVSTFMKLFRMAASVYTGASDGTSFIKNTLLNKMERRLDFIQKFLEKEKQTFKGAVNENDTQKVLNVA